MTTGIDLSDERELLAAHDFAALQARLTRALRLRRLRALAAGAVAALALLAALVAVTRPTTSTVAGTTAAATIARTARVASVPRPPALPRATPAARVAAAAVARVAAPPVARITTPRATATARRPAPAASARSDLARSAAEGAPAPDDAVVGERFHLRAQMRLYEEAAAETDTARALALVRRLRDEDPAGPLVTEARLLEVKLLLDAGRFDEAQHALTYARSAARSSGKGLAWEALRARLERASPAPRPGDAP